MPEIDYDKLARQHGGVVVEQGVDYDALAAELGGTAVEDATQEQPAAPGRSIGEGQGLALMTEDERASGRIVPYPRLNLPDPGVVAASAPVAFAPVMAPALAALPGALGRWVVAHPNMAGALGGAATGAMGGGSVSDVAQNALLGAIGLPPAMRGVPASLLRKLAGKAAPKARVLPIPKPKAAAPVAQPATPKVAATPARNTPIRKAAHTKEPASAAPKKPDLGKAAVADHAKHVAFAKEIAAKHPKVGEKIWMELDANGTPVKWLTPDQAAGAARRGVETTWIRNLWR